MRRMFWTLGSSILLSALLLAAGAPAAVPASTAYWPLAKAMRMLDGTRVRVGSRVVRIRSETTLCAGEGASIRRRGVRRWSRFTCTYTTFTRQGLDRDLDFRIRVTGARRFTIVDAHWVRAPR
jgi:hypothetical protein